MPGIPKRQSYDTRKQIEVRMTQLRITYAGLTRRIRAVVAEFEQIKQRAALLGVGKVKPVNSYKATGKVKMEDLDDVKFEKTPRALSIVRNVRFGGRG